MGLAESRNRRRAYGRAVRRTVRPTTQVLSLESAEERSKTRIFIVTGVEAVGLTVAGKKRWRPRCFKKGRWRSGSTVRPSRRSEVQTDHAGYIPLLRVIHEDSDLKIPVKRRVRLMKERYKLLGTELYH